MYGRDAHVTMFRRRKETPPEDEHERSSRTIKRSPVPHSKRLANRTRICLSGSMPTIPLTASVTEDDVYNKVAWRTIPLLFLCYIAAYLDRVNVGFAKLQMQADLKFSETVYSFGAGIFFIGYFLFEVPSNLLLERLGARFWIARIMISWGVISAATMFARSALVFYALRFLLGVAEAGFFPGIILYLTYFFPSKRRAGIVALFMMAIAVTG